MICHRRRVTLSDSPISQTFHAGSLSMRLTPFIACLTALFVTAAATAADSITVHKRLRVDHPNGTFQVKELEEKWDPKQTAIIVCDVWDSHHCVNAVRRVME